MKRKLYLVLLALLCSCSSNKESIDISDSTSKQNNSTIEQSEIIEDDVMSNGFEGTVGNINFKLKDLGDAVSIHTKLQEDYLKDDYNNIEQYAYGNAELSFPNNISLEFEVSGNQEEKYQVFLSESKNFDKFAKKEVFSQNVTFTNLKIDTKYYWYVQVDNQKSGIASFKTQGIGPRNMHIDGVSNFRDVGGWQIDENKRVKQGMIYRCGALNYSGQTKNIITQTGIEQLKELGIKTEIDLRGAVDNENGGITISPIGESVNYCYIPMTWNSDLLIRNATQVAEVFKILANKDNYPVIIHCAGGSDRTGMMAFLINALCGVSEADLYRDYLFTNFYHSNDPRPLSTITNANYVATIKKEQGNNLVLKTYQALYKYGVDTDDIDAVIEIMSD